MGFSQLLRSYFDPWKEERDDLVSSPPLLVEKLSLAANEREGELNSRGERGADFPTLRALTLERAKNDELFMEDEQVSATRLREGPTPTTTRTTLTSDDTRERERKGVRKFITIRA